MELKIKLEAYEDVSKFTPFSEAESKISIREDKKYSAETLLVSILIHLYNIIKDDVDDTGKRTE